MQGNRTKAITRPLFGIISAFKEELKDYLKSGKFREVARSGRLRFHRSETEPNVIVIEGAYGRDLARVATRKLVEGFGPKYIVSAGFAGGVQGGLNTGDLFLCGRLLSVEGPVAWWRRESASTRSAPPPTFLEDSLRTNMASLEVGHCGCLSVPQLITSSRLKAWVGATFPVTLVDMEGFWVSETASELGVPHAIVRSVLDPMEQTLPEIVRKAAGESGHRRWSVAVKHIASRPAQIPELMRLSGQVNVASGSLAEFLSTLKSASMQEGQ